MNARGWIRLAFAGGRPFRFLQRSIRGSSPAGTKQRSPARKRWENIDRTEKPRSAQHTSHRGHRNRIPPRIRHPNPVRYPTPAEVERVAGTRPE